MARDLSKMSVPNGYMKGRHNFHLKEGCIKIIFRGVEALFHTTMSELTLE